MKKPRAYKTAGASLREGLRKRRFTDRRVPDVGFALWGGVPTPVVFTIETAKVSIKSGFWENAVEGRGERAR